MRPRSLSRAWLWPVLIAGAVTGADLAAKYWARSHLIADRLSHGGGLRLGLVTNRGAAWGLGSSSPTWVAGVEVVGVALVGWWLLSRETRGERAWLAVILGGAMGNLVERLGRGAVTDWIHIAPYPPYFNLADIAIRGGLVVAAVLIVVRRPGRLPIQTEPAVQDEA